MPIDVSFGSLLMAIVTSLTAILIVNMWLVVGSDSASTSGDGEATLSQHESREEATVSVYENKGSIVVPFHADPPLPSANNDDDDDDPVLASGSNSDNNWRCACEGGFLPPGLLKSFGGAEAVMRLGTGQCYHQKAA
ncbi:hypothetical protein MHU86_3496 [Fragilaria crotonensis]|nr:hypothetical protein MHU86_9237 [Fragilaria crotonensis]KAI2510875.1 hypothetical protein MHU86_3496 [Fragilaria crotonensis]